MAHDPQHSSQSQSRPLNKNLARTLGRQVRSVQRFRQSVREVVDLQWVKEWTGNPPHKNTLRGMTAKQRKGKRYEEAFGAHLEKLSTDPSSILYGTEIRIGQWLRFEDTDGKSWAQPDFYALDHSSLWLFENKLTYVESALEQLTKLYGPLLAHLYPSHTQFRVVVCHDLCVTASGFLPRAYRSLDEILAAELADTYVWVWRGGV